MKRFLLVSSFAAACAVLWGCPIYPDNASHRVCDGNGCWDCPTDTYTSSCVAWQCNTANDCPSGYSCDSYGECVAGIVPPPYDGGGGDCTQNGCPTGQVCKFSNQEWQCVKLDAGGSGDSGADAGLACNADSQCGSLGLGARCIDGLCTAAVDQCFDQTQCKLAGESCVNGVCLPGCDAQHACPTGYACDTQKSVCTLNPTPCSLNQPCGNGTICVEQRCVPPCGQNESCAQNLVCVNGGCIPDEAPSFVCATEGLQGACASGSLCLHHNCYVACDMDAGSTACKLVDQFNVCKAVTTKTGTYDVCGSNTNLGGECDPTAGKTCTSNGAICIDGYCR